MLEKIRQSKILTLLLLTAVVYFFLQYLTPLFSPILVAMAQVKATLSPCSDAISSASFQSAPRSR